MASGGLESKIVEEKSENEKPVNREKTCPLLLRVFCNTGRHNSILQYAAGTVPGNELQIYTWKDATLKELSTLVKEVNPDAKRKGTTLHFALVAPDPTRPNANLRARDLGATISGHKGPDDNKTLAQLKFRIGDFLDIGIFPPTDTMGMDRMERIGMERSMPDRLGMERGIIDRRQNRRGRAY
ncbi:histone deacetylase complex subunit SAP18 [Cloeon dipterum]|uniref:18 kDa Sin3-associated polypeptide n=1 Tax=Cloeon dipterum TaxID=197152 RepID=A0A8S1CMG7_9INSE|nr:Hypothetical predicted protein [Cloeon dipterum]